jgi:hypothetical protein
VVADVSGEGRARMTKALAAAGKEQFEVKWVTVWSEVGDKKLRAEAEKLAARVVEDCGKTVQSQVAGAKWDRVEKLGKNEVAGAGVHFGWIEGNVRVYRVSPGREWLSGRELDRWAVFPKLGLVVTCETGGGFRRMSEKDVDVVRAAFVDALAPLMKLEKVEVREGGW